MKSIQLTFLKLCMMVLIAGLAVTACKDSPTSVVEDEEIIQIVADTPTEPEVQVFVSDNNVDTWDAIGFEGPANTWPNFCVDTPAVGLDANWVNPHKATQFPRGTASFEGFVDIDANWINAWSTVFSSGSGVGHQNWTRYSTTVSGEGDYVIQFVADNCSWIYIDGEIVGNQTTDITDGRFPLTLPGGDVQLEFIILDGGGEAGGLFRLETLESFVDNGGDLDDLPDENTAPEANAGADQTVDATGPTTAVTLDGSGSSDTDGDALSYLWSLNGSEVSTSATPTVNLADGSYTYTLTVSDGEETDSDEVTVEVINNPPVADAGADQTTEATGVLTTATLDGTGSSDPNGDAISYSWSMGGSEVATGAAPSISVGVGSHTVSLTVTDEHGATATDEVVVNVVDTTAPELSYNVLDTSLWPPNHKMRLVVSGISVADIADPNAAVDITVTSNEAINGQGDGNTDADWEVQGGNVYVRAERSGKGDGRVYTITINGSDASGNVTTETVEVTVPHNKGKGKNK